MKLALSQGKRPGVVTVEYAIIALLVIGIGGTAVGFRGNIADHVSEIGNYFKNTVESLSKGDSTSTTGGNTSTGSNTPSVDNSQGGNDSEEEDEVVEMDETAVLLAKTSLDNYSWTELKTIANDLSSNGTSSVYYDHMYALMQSGSTKTFDTGDSTGTVGSKLKVRIIGICQDQKSDGSGSAGITFQATHALATAYQLRTTQTTAGGWGDSSTIMRSWLNGTVYSMLPSDLRSSIVSVKKYYGTTYNSKTSDTSSCNDYLFLLSMKELYDYSNDTYPWCEYEGTGSGHNKQYQFYALNKVTTSNCSLLTNMHLTYSGGSTTNNNGSFWWLRSASHFMSNCFRCVYPSGSYEGSDANDVYSVVPAFSI